jgi:hypothetical protein
MNEFINIYQANWKALWKDFCDFFEEDFFCFKESDFCSA